MAIVVQRDAGLTVGRLLAGEGRTHLIGRGGLLLGGSAPHTVAYSKVPAGGLALGGSGPHALPPNLVGAGGLLLGGSAPHSWAARRVASGGLLLGGSAPHSVSSARTASGGLMLGGTARHVYLPAMVASGGLLLGGTAPHTVPLARVASGGLLLGGTAPHSYVPAEQSQADAYSASMSFSGTGGAWTNLGNLTDPDGFVATATVAAGGHSQTIEGSNVQWLLPAGATVDGIKARVWVKASVAASVGWTLRLRKAGGTLSSVKSQPSLATTTITEYDVGGPTDTWGLTLSGADVNDLDFTWLFAATNSAGSGRVVSLDCVWLSVWYHT